MRSHVPRPEGTPETKVISGFADAPVPTVAIDGLDAVISGVRFAHVDHCWSCRRAVYVFTDAGTVKLGLESSRSAKTVRWYLLFFHDVPVPPGSCPHCGCDRAFGTRAFTARSGSPIKTQPLENEVWLHLRARHPTLAGLADKRDTRLNWRA